MVQIQTGASKCTKMTGIANPGKTVSIIMRGSNKLMLEEADRYNVFSFSGFSRRFLYVGTPF